MYTSDKAKVMMIKLTILAITGLVLFGITNAYADHVDNYIWIETAEGKFTPYNESIESIYNPETIDLNNINNIFIHKDEYETGLRANEEYRKWNEYTYNGNIGAYELDKPEFTRINGVTMFESNYGCGDMTKEKEYLEANQANEISMTLQKYHEYVCGYWYHNTLKDSYTYTIIDLPEHTKTPIGYNDIIRTGIEAGLESWGNINNIEFSYTDSRLKADIIIQQGENTGPLGNAETGCIHRDNQCTIQLFTKQNSKYSSEIIHINEETIKWVIAHEFGHLTGLPHHIDPNNIMHTPAERATDRTYYEIHGINVPNISQPTNMIYEPEPEQITVRICDAMLVTSDEIYQEMIRYPDRYTDQLLAFTGTVATVSGDVIPIDNPLLHGDHYAYDVWTEGSNGKFTDDNSRILRDDEIIVFGWIITGNYDEVHIDVEAIYMLKDFDLCDNITTRDSTPVEDTQINYCEDNSQIWTEDNILEHKAVQETIKVLTTIAINGEDQKHPAESIGDMSLNILYEMQAVYWEHMGVDSEECYTLMSDPKHAEQVCSRLD